MLKLATKVNHAAKAGDIRILRRLLKEAGDVNAFDRYDGFSALHAASFGGRLKAVKFLLSAGARIDIGVSEKVVVDFRGATPLMLACMEGHAEVARFLISAGASVSLPSPSVMNYAARSGRADIVKMVVAAGASLSRGAMFEAMKALNPEVISALIEAGADVNQKDPLGTPLIVRACCVVPRIKASRSQLRIVEALLKAGADINDRTIGGCTPLMEAAGNGKLSLVKLLIAKGADVNARAAEDITALHWAVLDGYVEVAKILLISGADPHVVWERKGEYAMRRGSSVEIARKQKIPAMLKAFGITPKKK